MRFPAPTAAVVVNAYAVTLAAACFAWPVVLGMRGTETRLAWVACAFALLCFSCVAADKAFSGRQLPTSSRDRAPWWFFAAVAIPGFAIGAAMPITVFSDEEALALPALAAVSGIARTIGWPALLIAVAVALCLAAVAVRRLTPRGRLYLLACGGAGAAGVAVLVPQVMSLATRYPPLVHVAQTAATLLAATDPTFFRLQNAAWTVLTCHLIWRYLPEYSKTARMAAMAVLTLTPLGLTYRVLLYQVSGEIWFATAMCILLAAVFSRADKDANGGPMGMLFGLWILYRPTALAACGATVVLLWIMGYKKASRHVALIALPVGMLWIAVYVFGTFQYDFLRPSSGRVWNLASFSRPLFQTLRQLPDALHPLGIAVLVAGSLFAALRSASSRGLLLWAWTIALTNVALHELLTVERWYGYGRFNALLIVPLLCAVLGIADKRATGRYANVTALAVVVALAAVTPWNFATFLQRERSVPASDVERRVAGGSVPTAAATVIHDMLLHDTIPGAFLSPSYGFLDLEIARGLLTVPERERLMRASAAWSPDDGARPVVIQAPTENMRYWGNLTDEDERRLTEAAEWALEQPTVRTFPYGEDRVLIVE